VSPGILDKDTWVYSSPPSTAAELATLRGTVPCARGARTSETSGDGFGGMAEALDNLECCCADDDEAAMWAACAQDDDAPILDSGCTTHLTSRRELLHDYLRKS
jgi:hypothetical protein